jgi:arylsulfatase A-like enzyme
MTRVTFVCFLCLLACAGMNRAAETGPDQPNIVFVLADDLGWSDLGCYGSDLHETPHLDKFANQSVRFTNAYAASPVCTPTRASILTGKFPARLHMTIWRESAAERGRRRLLEPVARGDLPLEEVTLAERLQQAGYYTAHVGKWHLGTAKSYPQPHGFDVNVGGTLWGAPQTFFYPYRGEQYFRDWRYVPDLEAGNEGDYLTDRLTDKALEIIDRQSHRPLFLNLWYHTVHTPIEGKPAVVEKYAARLKERADESGASPVHTNPDYAAMVESLDENVGRVLAKLEEKGIAERTVVVFFSDNGGFVGTCKLHPGRAVTNNAPLRSGKGSLYEGGIRVPLMIRWPGVTAPGRCDTPVFSCDLYTTLLKMVGLPHDPVHVPDGIDLTPYLKQPSQAAEPRGLFFHYPHYYPTTSPVSAVRLGDWKLLQYYEDDRVELYNLVVDPGERSDLSKEKPAVADRLQQRLQNWLNEVGAQMPEPNPTWKK